VWGRACVSASSMRVPSRWRGEGFSGPTPPPLQAVTMAPERTLPLPHCPAHLVPRRCTSMHRHSLIDRTHSCHAGAQACIAIPSLTALTRATQVHKSAPSLSTPQSQAIQAALKKRCAWQAWGVDGRAGEGGRRVRICGVGAREWVSGRCWWARKGEVWQAARCMRQLRCALPLNARILIPHPASVIHFMPLVFPRPRGKPPSRLVPTRAPSHPLHATQVEIHT